MEEKQEPIFADGLMWKDPHEKAPNFIKGALIVNAEKFNDFMKANMQHASEKGWLNIDMKESKNGAIYFQLNTWKKPVQEKVEPEKTNMTSTQPDGEPAINAEEIPF